MHRTRNSFMPILPVFVLSPLSIDLSPKFAPDVQPVTTSSQPIPPNWVAKAVAGVSNMFYVEQSLPSIREKGK
jgi:hypothetical protein